MADDPLFSSGIKIDRAKAHLVDLERQVKVFTNSNPYHVLTDRESEQGIEVHRLHIRQPVPKTLSAVIGDLLHNAMSAIDSLATALLKPGTSEDDIRKTYFPIHWKDRELSSNEKTLAFFKNAGPDVEKLVRRIEPYKGGRCDFLWRLKNLNIRDKHRAIIPVVASVGRITVSGEGWPPFGFDVPTKAPELRYDLKEGDELMRTGFFEPHYEGKTHFTFHIGIDQHKPLIERMAEFVSGVDGVVQLFRREIFKS